MSIVRFALLQKNLYYVSKKLLLVGKEVVWLVVVCSSSQRPHPSYQMVHLTIM